MRDALEELKSKNIAVIGISPDTPEIQKKFDDKHDLGFSLLSDPDHNIAEVFGVWGEKKMYGKIFKESFDRLFSLMKMETSKIHGTRSAPKIRFPN